jgi:hypothetical protein
LYKINPNSDKVGVFVSLVSTKIPFKGTGKEYIGDDDGRIGSVVKVFHPVVPHVCQPQLRLLAGYTAVLRAATHKDHEETAHDGEAEQENGAQREHSTCFESSVLHSEQNNRSSL